MLESSGKPASRFSHSLRSLFAKFQIRNSKVEKIFSKNKNKKEKKFKTKFRKVRERKPASRFSHSLRSLFAKFQIRNSKNEIQKRRNSNEKVFELSTYFNSEARFPRGGVRSSSLRPLARPPRGSLARKPRIGSPVAPGAGKKTKRRKRQNAVEEQEKCRSEKCRLRQGCKALFGAAADRRAGGVLAWMYGDCR
jgi:hypothetical protein